MTNIVKSETKGLRFAFDLVNGPFVGTREGAVVFDKSSGQLEAFPTRKSDAVSCAGTTGSELLSCI